MVAENVEQKDAKKTAKPKAQDAAQPAVKPAAPKPAAAQAKPAAKPVAATAKPSAPKQTTVSEKPAQTVKTAAKPAAAAEKPVPVAKPAAPKPAATEQKKAAPAAPKAAEPEAPRKVAPEPKQSKAEEPVDAPAMPAPKKEAEPERKAKAPAKKVKDDSVEIVDENDDKDAYKAKAKPELSQESLDSLTLKKSMSSKRPAFHRQEWFRYQKLGDKWRKPKGIHSKMRRHYNKRPPIVSIGYRGPKDTRGLHPSGFKEVMVHNDSELEFINPKIEAARVAHGVGFAKLMRIVLAADKKGVRLLNVSAEKQAMARKRAAEENVKLPETKGAVE